MLPAPISLVIAPINRNNWVTAWRMKMDASAAGACLCGAVRFRVFWPSLWVAHCHCTQCQRAHGAAFVTWVSVPSAQARIDDPDGMLRWHQSSLEAERGFCGSCGSSLFFRSSRWPGELHVARANFINPVDREPQAHAFFDTHVTWVTLGDALPRRNASEILASKQ